MYPNPGGFHECPGEGRSPGERPGSVERSLQPVRRRSQNSRGAGGLNAPSASSALDNLDQTLAVEQHADPLAADGARNARPVRARRSEGAADGPDRTGGEHRRRRLVRTAVEQSDGAAEPHVPGRQQPVAPGRRARVPGRRRISSTTTTASRFRERCAARYTFSSLANFLAGTYNNAGFTQTFGDDRGLADQSEPRHLRAGRVEGRPRVTLNLGCGTTCSSSRRSTPIRNNVSPRLGVAWSPFDSRRTIVRGSAGLFYDRVPLRALANALLSAGNTTDLARPAADRRQPVAHAGGSAGVPEHPERRRAVGHAAQPDDDGPRAAERVFASGERRGRAAARASARRSASATSTCAACAC